MKQSLTTLEDALADGLSVSACMYPYDFWATYLASPRFADGWQQVFTVPAGGGTVTFTLPSLMPWLLAAQVLVLVVAGVLAAPAIRRPEVRDPAKTARRAATLSEFA